jgi:hypothetical protein
MVRVKSFESFNTGLATYGMARVSRWAGSSGFCIAPPLLNNTLHYDFPLSFDKQQQI